jgi:ubiquitin-conjugating enzyme E2 M
MTHSTKVSWPKHIEFPREPADVDTEAAEDLRRDRQGFIANVKTSMAGGRVRGETFDRVIVR